jgi:hypothetical protein
VLILEASEKVGDPDRKGFGVLNGERAPLKDGLVGVTGRSEALMLEVRWREENVDLCNEEFGSTSGPEVDLLLWSLRSLRSLGSTKAAEAVRDEESRGVIGDSSMLGLGLGPNPRLPRCFLDGVFSARLRTDGVLIDRADELLPIERLLVLPDPGSRPLAVLGLDLLFSLSVDIS